MVHIRKKSCRLLVNGNLATAFFYFRLCLLESLCYPPPFTASLQAFENIGRLVSLLIVDVSMLKMAMSAALYI